MFAATTGLLSTVASETTVTPETTMRRSLVRKSIRNRLSLEKVSIDSEMAGNDLYCSESMHGRRTGTEGAQKVGGA